MEPLVSVVITAYNAETTIAETIESVLGQTYPALEIIVADDGSTDATAEIVRRFPAVKLLQQTNMGQPVARNLGIRASTGQFLAFIDSDDLWHPDKIRLQIQTLMECPEAGWSYCDCLHFAEAVSAPLYKNSQLLKPHSGWVQHRLLYENFISSPTPVIRREVFEIVGNWDAGVRQCEDWNMWLQIASRYPLVYVPSILAYHRHQNTSLSSQWNLPGYLDANLAVQEKAAEAYPLLRRHLSRAKATIYARFALAFLREGRQLPAVRCLWQATTLRPTYTRLYMRWPLVLLPPFVVQALYRLRRSALLARSGIVTW